jgi:hypothetical protein
MSSNVAASSLAPDMIPGLQLLVEGWQFAELLERDRWEFAVTIEELKAAGCSDNAFRFLIQSRLAENALELVGRKKRRFKKQKSLCLGLHSCFVLTDSGRRYALQREAELKGEMSLNANPALHPRFVHRELRVGARIIKKYVQPPQHQELVLSSFEELGWAQEIDDPLPPAQDVDSKVRLHQTIANLNRYHHVRLIHFLGDGTGQKVCWEWRS